MSIDFGSFSAEETISIAIEAMGNLTVDQRIEVVRQLFRNADALHGEIARIRRTFAEDGRPTLGLDATLDQLETAFEELPPFDEEPLL